jgi:hypothetical protein
MIEGISRMAASVLLSYSNWQVNITSNYIIIYAFEARHQKHRLQFKRIQISSITTQTDPNQQHRQAFFVVHSIVWRDFHAF